MPRNERQQTMSINSTVILLALLVWLSRLAPFIFPEARLWGVNHLLFLPIWFSFGYVLLGLAAAALFIPSVQRQAERALAAVAKATLSSPRYQIWGAIALAAGVIFWLLRMPTHFLGDGYEVVQNVGQPTMAVYKWTERGAIALVGLVARLLPFEGELVSVNQ